MANKMKLKPDSILNLFMPMIDETNPYLLPISANKQDLAFVEDPEQRAVLFDIAATLNAALRALLELHSVYEDLVTCYNMARRYPWRGTKIKRSQHLQFVWVQFINQCYLFKEKYKLAAGQINQAKKIFKQGPPIVVGVGLKEIDKALGKLIRVRGQHFHEWFEHNKHVQFFTMIELINATKRIDGPWGNIEGHYKDAKMMLGWEIESAGEFVESFFKGTVRSQIDDLAKATREYNRIVKRIERQSTRQSA
jgi:hypothetical protein